MLKAVLPPLAVDTPEELAQLSQFVVNIIDFRDPDATMTRFVNPDLMLRRPVADRGHSPDEVQPADRGLRREHRRRATFVLEQFGMEYNPVAINEVLAYSFTYRDADGPRVPKQTNRMYVELVNTLTEAADRGHGQRPRPDRLADGHPAR